MKPRTIIPAGTGLSVYLDFWRVTVDTELRDAEPASHGCTRGYIDPMPDAPYAFMRKGGPKGIPVSVLTRLLIRLAPVVVLAGCMVTQPEYPPVLVVPAPMEQLEPGSGPVEPAAWRAAQAESHNRFGGYIPACGQLPPLVGDDC